MASLEGARLQPAAVNRPWLITIAASAGGIEAIRTILQSVPVVGAADGEPMSPATQDEATSEHFSMPRSAIRSGAVDYVQPLDAIGPALNDIVRGRPVSVPSPQ
jgi:chemotaxis response regulator CheB